MTKAELERGVHRKHPAADATPGSLGLPLRGKRTLTFAAAMRLASADLSCDLRDSTYFSGAATGVRQPLPMSSSYTSTYANAASSCVVRGGGVGVKGIDQEAAPLRSPNTCRPCVKQGNAVWIESQLTREQ